MDWDALTEQDYSTVWDSEFLKTVRNKTFVKNFIDKTEGTIYSENAWRIVIQNVGTTVCELRFPEGIFLLAGSGGVPAFNSVFELVLDGHPLVRRNDIIDFNFGGAAGSLQIRFDRMVKNVGDNNRIA